MAEQSTLYDAVPDLAGRAWRCWTLDTPEEEATAAFLRRFGQHPQFVLERFHMLWVGPIPESE